MSDKKFVHLHCHSHYSLLDGASSIPKLTARAREHGMNALALTDHGNLHGALQFYRACKKEDLNPILGYEAYIAPGSRFERGASSMKEASYHLTLLAKNRTGFKNLVKLASAASLEGFYFKPRIDKEILAAHSEGLICLSGCLSSEFSRKILAGSAPDAEFAEACETAAWFEKIFGERYFIEVMNNGIDLQRVQLEGAVEIAKKMGLPVVATSDCHYINQDDAEAQDVMLCINTGKFRTDQSRMKMENDQFFLRSPEEMYRHFPGLEDAVARSQEIADSVDIDLELGSRNFPTYRLPPDRKPDEYLRETCLAGLRDRYADVPEMWDGDELAEVVIARLDRELGVINKLGFPNYFLIVWDFVVHARDVGIPATARGSGVGAIVCFALYMSHVCPLKYGLLFERFLDENRLEAPDIDIDFCKERRGEVIQYVKDKYGEDNVAQIGTFGTLAARAAIKDVGRALGIPLARVNQVTGMVPEELGITLDKALQKSDELKATYEGDGEIRELLDLARKIEGLARNVGTHAAAVVIADKPLTEYVPLGRVSGKDDIITQWSMNDVEDAGLLKMDFLGLRNLTMLRTSVDLIEQTTGERIDPLKFPLDDKPTYALLQRGETKGVFQLESGGIRDLLQRMKPDHFNDIIATAALYRPGPLEGGMVDTYVNVKNKRQEPEYKHEILKSILEETNSVMVYQEQVMQILNRLGGIELAKAYTCIKAISKKKESLIAQNHEQFIKGAVENGLTKQEAQEFWDMILKFAGYGFNKSHSTAYALIAYQTAYLKAHYPVEFMASLLTGDIPGRNFKRKDSLVEHLEDCTRMNIEVVFPSVNTSDVLFSVADGKIPFGLAAIKGCGGSSAEAIVAARQKDGPFKDLFDFCERVDPSACNRSTIETLIKAGAFDCFGAKRSQLLAVVDRALQAGVSAQADRKSGQRSLFGDIEEEEETKATVSLPDIPETPEREMLVAEKEVLGFYLRSHPLAEFEKQLRTYCTHTTSNIGGLADRTEIILGGMLSAIKFAHTKNPKPGAPSKYVNFDLEDVDGAIRCIQWPDGFAESGHLIQADAILVVRGVLDRRGGDEANLIVNELVPLDQLDAKYTRGIKIRIDEKIHGLGAVKTVREILRGYPGGGEVQLVLCLEEGTRVYVKSGREGVDMSKEMRARLDDSLGPGNYQTITAPPQVGRSNGNGNGRRYSKKG
ncbi:DNA polymerase III subunit alpha [Lignipirellula cremea]|uniref:DNA polymerase III subunit alpha n=1 Tax=Lignipirellula cremea TaxID=2528010 RepID=A0A518DW96_9BACT|nr:DNA polymerase III subunit alpha [Lignipirellula cremea]QDU96110.1 DNA polymerase III subunit alpha [Lignipirellula cremea]